MPVYQVAAACGLRDWQLGDYIHGRRTIPGVHIRRICEVLDCNPNDIIE